MRFRMRSKPAITTINHYETTNLTVAATPETTIMFNCTDAPANRGANVPEGAVMKFVMVKLWATDATPVAGKHQCAILYRPGGMAFAAEPITGWYSTTDPMTQGAIEARKHMLGHGVHTIVTVTGASGAPRMVCIARMNRSLRDGDDIVLAQRDDGATNWNIEATAKWIA